MNSFPLWWDGLFPLPPAPEKKPFDLDTLVAEAQLRLTLQLERDVAAHLRQLRSGGRHRLLVGNGLGVTSVLALEDVDVTSSVLALGCSGKLEYALLPGVSDKKEKEGTLFGLRCLPSRVHPYLRRFIKKLE
jgi:hypothetical protein